MKSKPLLWGAVGLSLTVGLLAGCNDDDNRASTATPVAPTSVSDDTAQVLLLAQKTSDTSSPVNVDGGAFTLNDTSETSDPITVNAM